MAVAAVGTGPVVGYLSSWAIPVCRQSQVEEKMKHIKTVSQSKPSEAMFLRRGPLAKILDALGLKGDDVS